MGRFVTPNHQEFDANGAPLSGGKMEFYATGGLVAKDTFSDEALSSVNTNAVVADSAGRFGDVWLESGDYRVILKDSDDVTIWDKDPVKGTIGSAGTVGVAKTANYTVTLDDSSTVIQVNATSGPLTMTLLAAATAGNGFEITVKKTDSSNNFVTVDANATETIDGALTFVIKSQFESITLRSDGANWVIIPSVKLPSPEFTSTEQTVTADTLLTVAHGLGGVIPALWTASLLCKTAELGYAIGDEVQVKSGAPAPSTDRGVTMWVDLSGGTINISQGVAISLHNASFVAADIVVANWKWIVRVWK